jgi:hypothetical protein
MRVDASGPDAREGVEFCIIVQFHAKITLLNDIAV